MARLFRSSAIASLLVLALGAAGESPLRAQSAQTVFDLGILLGDSSFAYGIDDAGQIVGTYGGLTHPFHAFSWTESGGVVDLGTIGGSTSEAVAVNANGEI